MKECNQKSKDKLEIKQKSIFTAVKLPKLEKSMLNDSVISSKNRKNTNPRRNLLTLNSPIKYNNSNLMLNCLDLSQSRIDKDIINITEDNPSNISIFPANKNYHSSIKDSMSIDETFNNKSLRSDNQRNRSLNPFNKNGNRIQKISNLLGHIFDKKIEQIRSKFSSTL